MYTPELVEWQIVDLENGLVMPWFTHPSLDWIKQQDWSDKNVLMFGAGLGDAWLAKRCKNLYVIERNEDWWHKAHQYSVANGAQTWYEHRPCNDGSGAQDFYTAIPDRFDFDVIINDDAYRTEVCQVAVDYFKKRGGGTLVCDNWDQDFVWLSPKALEIMAPFESKVFPQPGHINHEGKCWKTAVFFIK